MPDQFVLIRSACSLFCLTCVELCITDSFHSAKGELTFLHICVKMSTGRCKVKVPWKMVHWKCFLYHDPVSTHSALAVQEFQACNGMTVVSHPLYSPDLAPCDFFLFVKLKVVQKGRNSYDISIMQEQVQTTLEDSWTEDISKWFNSGTIAELTLSSYKYTALKGMAWNNVKMLLSL